MKAQRPYLYKAIYEWIVDNGCTPYLLVDATVAGVIVPSSFVKDGKIVLNVSGSAIHGYLESEAGIQFSARFSGKNENLFVPYASMIALYARENAQGMVFPSELVYQELEEKQKSNLETDNKNVEDQSNTKKTKPSLTIIK